MRYLSLLGDEKEWEGDDYSDVVHAMSEQKLRRVRSADSYRRSTARRVKEIFNVEIDPTDDESFIKSLELAKLLERLDGG